MIPNNRIPNSPRDILIEEFLKPLGVNKSVLALLDGHDVDKEMAVELAKFANNSPEFWLALQNQLNKYLTGIKEILSPIK